MLLKQGVSLCAQCVGCVLCDPGLVQKLTLLSKAAQTAGMCSRTLHLAYPELPYLPHLSGQLPSAMYLRCHLLALFTLLLPLMWFPAPFLQLPCVAPPSSCFPSSHWLLPCVESVTYNCFMCVR